MKNKKLNTLRITGVLADTALVCLSKTIQCNTELFLCKQFESQSGGTGFTVAGEALSSCIRDAQVCDVYFETHATAKSRNTPYVRTADGLNRKQMTSRVLYRVSKEASGVRRTNLNLYDEVELLLDASNQRNINPVAIKLSPVGNISPSFTAGNNGKVITTNTLAVELNYVRD